MFPSWITNWVRTIHHLKNVSAVKDLIGDEEYVAGYPPWVATGYIAGARLKKRADAERLLFLLRAIEDGDAVKVRELLGQGISAKLSLGPPDGTLFRFAAQQTRNPDCLQALLEAGADGKDPETLTTLAVRGHGDALLELAKRGAALDVRTDEGYTPLSSAIEIGSVETVKKLLDAGATVDFTTTYEGPWPEPVKEVTPLMMASYIGVPNVVKVLLQAGADPTKTDPAGRNAMAWAKKSSPKKATEKIQAMLEQAGLSREGGPGIPEPPDFSARAKTPEFKNTLEIAKRLTGQKGLKVELEEGPVPGGRAFPVETDKALEVLINLRSEMKAESPSSRRMSWPKTGSALSCCRPKMCTKLSQPSKHPSARISPVTI